jgi:putative ABC transport system substrate-binding protein
MILSTASLKGSTDATAVLLQPSAQKQLEWHRHFLPDARRVGVLYDPNESQAWVDEAMAAASKLNLKIIATPVKSPQEIPGALKSLARRADSILGIPDKTVYSSKTAKSILLFSFRNRIPFVGMSAAWVKAGALYGVDWDYEELGRQCAAVALQIIDGASAADIAPQLPDNFVYQLNMKTARQLKVEISPKLIAGASRVYE